MCTNKESYCIYYIVYIMNGIVLIIKFKNMILYHWNMEPSIRLLDCVVRDPAGPLLLNRGVSRLRSQEGQCISTQCDLYHFLVRTSIYYRHPRGPWFALQVRGQRLKIHVDNIIHTSCVALLTVILNLLTINVAAVLFRSFTCLYILNVYCYITFCVYFFLIFIIIILY